MLLNVSISITLTITNYSSPYSIVFLRWGNTPLDDAMQFGHDVIVSVLQKYQHVYTEGDAPCDAEEQKTSLDTLKSIV